MSKIKIEISSCLLGNQVRYDGQHKYDHFLVKSLGEFMEYIPVCPEVECGLPVPRDAMRLVGDSSDPRLVAIKTKIDLTEQMRKWGENKDLSPCRRSCTKKRCGNFCRYVHEKISISPG